MEQRIDATPSVHLLNALCKQKLGWVDALAELIDNSFNAGATRVVVRCGNKSVSVEDDGRGMLDVTSAVRLGDHRVDLDAGIGMYGIGLKDAWLYAGDSITVTSNRAGKRCVISTSVREMIGTGDWSVSPPIESETIEQNGTTIKLGLKPGRNLPSKDNMSKLAWAFTPALLSGKQILWVHRNVRMPLIPNELPPLVDVVNDEFEVDGKVVKIHIGLVQDGHSMPNGPLWYQHKHRTICKSYLGVHRYNNERIGGIVTLGSGWSLTKNKDDFDDNKEALGNAIENRCRMLLAKAEQLTVDVQSAALNTELESMVNDAVATLKREKRNSGESSGSKIPAYSGRKRKRAAQTSENAGSVEVKGTSRNRGRLKIAWRALDGNSIGEFDHLSDTITLNIDNAFVDYTRKSGDKPLLFALAMSVFADYVCTHQDGSKTLFEVRGYSQTLGEILRTMVPNTMEAISA